MFVALRTDIATKVSQLLCTLLTRLLLWVSVDRFHVKFDNYHREEIKTAFGLYLWLWCVGVLSCSEVFWD